MSTFAYEYTRIDSSDIHWSTRLWNMSLREAADTKAGWRRTATMRFLHFPGARNDKTIGDRYAAVSPNAKATLEGLTTRTGNIYSNYFGYGRDLVIIDSIAVSKFAYDADDAVTTLIEASLRNLDLREPLVIVSTQALAEYPGFLSHSSYAEFENVAVRL